MNSKLKGIIVCGVVVLCLGGTLAILELTGAAGNDSSSADDSSRASLSTSSEDESVQLVNKEPSDIVKITAVNEHGGYTYVGESEAGKETAYIEELKGLTLNANMISDLSEDIAQLKAYKLVEEGAQDLSKYGLSEPAAQFTVEYADGTEQTFCIGDTAPQNRYKYFCEKDSADVYMVLASSVANYAEAKESFVNTTLLAQPQDSEMPEYGRLTVSRTDIDYDISFITDPYNYENMPSALVMDEPIFAYLNVDLASDVTYGMYGLTAMSAEVVFPTEDDMKEYGLDKPMTTVNFKGEGYDYTLTIGNEYHETDEDGKEQTAVSAYYCYFTGVDGKDCIWKVDASSLQWTTFLPGDVITSMMTWNMITTVNSVNISGDVTADFELTTATDEEGDEDVAKVTLDGKEVSVDDFKSYYQYILTCPTSDVCFKQPEGEPYLTMEIKCDDGKTDKLEFYKETERRTIVMLNEITPYRIQSSWVDRMLKNVEAVRNGEKIVDTY